MVKIVAAMALLWLIANPASAETVDVKYRGPVPLETFDCPALKSSSFVNRICFYDEKSYLIVQLKQTYYHYCDLPEGVFADWVSAPSLGRFYNQNIKGGIYSCQGKSIPEF